jgi:flagellar biogenesis protein FliO
VANRPLFIALGVIALVMVLSWALGEFLRQRRTTRRRPKARR